MKIYPLLPYIRKYVRKSNEKGMLNLEETCNGMQAALKGKDKFFELNQKAIERGFDFIAKA